LPTRRPPSPRSKLGSLSATYKANCALPLSGALEKVDVRAKLFSLLSSLDFNTSTPLTDNEQLVLTAAQQYVPLAAGEAWRDTLDDFTADGIELLDADMAKLSARLDADASIADGLIGEQRAVSSNIAAQEEVADAAELKRVRVLRDGPMYGMPKQKRGTSLFRMRIEAKARIGNMVSASKVGYRGPTPTPAEFADATVAAATEAALDAGADPDGVITFTLRHVPQALATVANAAGIGPGYIDPFLFSAGVGLTSSGKKVDSPARLRLRISDDGAPNLDVRALEKEKTRAVSADELRQLCIEFQEYVAANPDANKPA